MQQLRAKYALEKVKEAAQNLSQSEQIEFKSYAAALPAMIHMNGLGQAVAFYKSKCDKSATYLKIYSLLSCWLCSEDQPFAGKADLLDAIVESRMQTYRMAQVEAQALMDWVKKFAKTYLADKD